MSTRNSKRVELDAMEPTVPLGTALLVFFGVIVGTLLVVNLLDSWLPTLGQSFTGSTPQAYWDLARSSGIVAYLLMWLSVAFGLIITNRMARVWPGGPTAFDIHQFASLMGVAFAVFHGLILLGDQYIKYTLLQILIPFGSVNYQQFWVGLGQLAFYMLIPITFSFYIRKQISSNVWRWIHYGSFISFAMITVHALLAGSDATNILVLGMYALTGASIFFLTMYRMISMADSATA
jgi:predicted ferric reductase